MSLAGTTSHSRREYGRLADGRLIHEHTLSHPDGLRLTAIDHGGIVTSLWAPDAGGHDANVVLGLADLEAYVAQTAHLGTIVGRYGNRIAGGRYELDGHAHRLSVNDGAHALHGGPGGFGSRVWAAQTVPSPADEIALEFTRTSPDGEEGHPGELDVAVRYTLLPGRIWRIDYRATTTRPTVVNLTHHDYFNLAGAGSVLDHRLTLAASRFAPVDSTLIPVGLADVAGTPFDFRTPRRIADRIADDDEQLRRARGYDHNWVLDDSPAPMAFAARLEDVASGRTMDIWTTEPGIQFYSGNFLDGTFVDADGRPIERGAGLCLETQHFPDSPNRPEFPSTVLRPGETFHSRTEHRFGIR